MSSGARGPLSRRWTSRGTAFQASIYSAERPACSQQPFFDGTEVDYLFAGKLLPFENNCPFVRYSLRFNNFIGSIDETIGRCKSLVYLDLSFNMLNGTVPDAIRSPLAQADSTGGGLLQ
jgi:hypothetical protein